MKKQEKAAISESHHSEGKGPGMEEFDKGNLGIPFFALPLLVALMLLLPGSLAADEQAENSIAQRFKPGPP
jgi:hypothetical protein